VEERGEINIDTDRTDPRTGRRPEIRMQSRDFGVNVRKSILKGFGSWSKARRGCRYLPAEKPDASACANDRSGAHAKLWAQPSEHGRRDSSPWRLTSRSRG